MYPAFMISSRHLITSAQVVDGFDPNSIQRSKCKDGTTHFELTANQLGQLNAELAKYIEDGYSNEERIPVRGYIPLFCNLAVSEKMKKYRVSHPLFVEIPSDVPYKHSTPCLVTDKIQQEQLKQYDLVGEKIVPSNVTIQNDLLIIAESNQSAYQGTGGALVQFSFKDQVTLVGIGLTDTSQNTTTKYFYDMNMLNDSLCSLIGVCKKSVTKSPPVEVPTSEPNESTKSPTEPSTTSANPPDVKNPDETTPKIPMRPAVPNTTPETLKTRKPAPNPHEEYLDSLEELKEMAKEDPDVDDDLLIGTDDWDSAGVEKRIELVFVLICVMILG